MTIPPPHVALAAARMRGACRCNWSDSDRDAVTTYLAANQAEPPPDFPFTLRQQGTSWVLDPA
jgi:hypothetical protein